MRNKNSTIIYSKEKIKTWQGYDQKKNQKLVLNKLKTMGNSTFIYTPWALSSNFFFKQFPIYMWPIFTHVRQCAPMYELWVN
jgi:hypothetical protein